MQMSNWLYARSYHDPLICSRDCYWIFSLQFLSGILTYCNPVEFQHILCPQNKNNEATKINAKLQVKIINFDTVNW